MHEPLLDLLNTVCFLFINNLLNLEQVHFKADGNGESLKSRKGGRVKSSVNSVGSDERQISVTIAGVHSIQSNDTSEQDQPIGESGSNNESLSKKELTIIEERTSSRASGLSASEAKRG